MLVDSGGIIGGYRGSVRASCGQSSGQNGWRGLVMVKGGRSSA